MENSLAVAYKVKHTLTYIPSTFPDIYPKEIKTSLYKKLYTNIYSDFIHNHQKQEKQPNVLHLVQLNKLWYIHKMEFYSAIKRGELLILITSKVNVKCILLNERSQIQKVMILFM